MVLVLVLEVAELVQVWAEELLVVLVEVMMLVRRADRPGNVRNLLLVMRRILGALQLLLLLLVAALCHFILLLRDLYPHSITAIPEVSDSSNLTNFTVSPKLGLLLHNHHTRIAKSHINSRNNLRSITYNLGNFCVEHDHHHRDCCVVVGRR